MVLEDASATWKDQRGGEDGELRGITVRRDARGVTIEARSGQVRSHGRRVAAEDGRVQWGPDMALMSCKVRELVLAFEAPAVTTAGPSPSEQEETPARAQTQDAGVPLVAFPDLRRLRALTAAIVERAAEQVPEGVQLQIDALTFKLGEGSATGALTLGPGMFTLGRAKSDLNLRFTAGANAESAAFSLRAALPIGPGDIRFGLQGGPLSLQALGIREGEWGLVDVEHATVAGSVRLDLSGDQGSLTFDASAATRGIALQDPRLASEVVPGINVELRARGLASSDGELRLDDFAATVGTIRLGASGSLHQDIDHVAGTLHAEIASASCQSILDSMPQPLLPALRGARVAGSFGVRGELAFDTRSLDDLRLDYEVQDDCRAVEVPENLAREHFRAPFAHRIYLPDRTTTEVLTGPGTKDWTPLEAISPYMQVAVMTTEDGAFPKHRGFNRGAIRASLIANLKARRFVRGASTITMQLAKNLFLTREKTISRKLEEVALTEYLEQAFNKDELMELYLNVIEFGPGVYGIGPAADFYFGRTPAELNLAECLFLSSLLPSPLRYSKMHDAEQPPEGWMKALRATMQIANKRGLISDGELAEARDEAVLFWHGGPRPEPRPPVRAHTRFGADDETGDEFQAPPLAP